MTRTLQQQLTFDNGLTIGTHPVLFQLNGAERKALVTIGKKGSYPRVTFPGSMYLTTYKVKGDSLEVENVRALYVYEKEFNEQVANPTATVVLTRNYN